MSSQSTEYFSYDGVIYRLGESAIYERWSGQTWEQGPVLSEQEWLHLRPITAEQAQAAGASL